MLKWQMLHPRATLGVLGYIPYWLHAEDPDPAWKQIHKNYSHGGGWRSSKDIWEDYYIHGDTLHYPGDPPLHPIAKTKLRDETILFYPHAWIVIKQSNGDWDVARID